MRDYKPVTATDLAPWAIILVDYRERIHSLHAFWPDDMMETVMDFLAHKSELMRPSAYKALSPHQKKLVGDEKRLM
jgi:hypothetical protein